MKTQRGPQARDARRGPLGVNSDDVGSQCESNWLLKVPGLMAADLEVPRDLIRLMYLDGETIPTHMSISNLPRPLRRSLHRSKKRE